MHDHRADSADRDYSHPYDGPQVWNLTEQQPAKECGEGKLRIAERSQPP